MVNPFERRQAVKHFEYEYPQRPPIHRIAVTLAGDNFRRQVFVGPHEGHRPYVDRFGDDLEGTASMDGLFLRLRLGWKHETARGTIQLGKMHDE